MHIYTQYRYYQRTDPVELFKLFVSTFFNDFHFSWLRTYNIYLAAESVTRRDHTALIGDVLAPIPQVHLTSIE